MAALLNGARLGPYEILAPLGAGGMGDVYRARDTRLDRPVAIKLLNAELSGDAVSRARFEREARSIAALSHPHICTLHDVGDHEGNAFLVMELLEGHTLAARLANSRGGLSVAEALSIATQVADALAVAHRQHIVHRDIKPANIMLTPTGAKLVDFGLARLRDRDEVTGESRTQSALTEPHAVMGTLAYMSPEQLDGRADQRSDIFAFGAVLFEMLTGRRAFPGASSSAVIAAVVHTEPPAASTLRPQVSTGLDRVIRRCLEKNPDNRWQSAADLADDLRWIAAAATQVTTAPGTRGSNWTIRALATVVVLTAIAGAAISWPKPETPAPATKFLLYPPSGRSFPVVSQGGAPAVSPDGRFIAFVAEGSDGRRLWVRSLDTFAARPLPGTDGASNPAWSADNRAIAFVVEGGLKRINLDGGEAQVVAKGLAAGSPTWSSSGTIMWSAADNLMVTSTVGGPASTETQRDSSLFEENHYAPCFLPDGRHYLFLVRGGAELQFQLYVGQLGSKVRHLLLRDVTSAQYVPANSGLPGSLLFVRDGQLLAQPFDLARLALDGEPRIVAEGVGVHSFGIFGDFSASSTGVLAYRREEPGKHELVWIDREGRSVATVGDRPGNKRNNLRLSPDGKAVAYTRLNGDTQDVWTHDFSRGVPARITLNGGRSPVWSPDGTQIAYLRGDTIFRKPVAGGAEVAVWKGAGILALNDWSGDNRHLLLTRWDASEGMNGRGLWLLSLEAGSAGKEPALLEARALHGMFAPANGAARWIAFDRGGQTFVRTMPGEEMGLWQVSVDGGNGVRWRRDGRELFFLAGRSLMAMAVSEGPTFHAGSLRELFVAPPSIRTAVSQYALGYDVAADGQRFLATSPTTEAPGTAIHIEINWQSGLRK